MKLTKNLNSLSEIEFTTIFGSIFEKSKWIANEVYKQKPFKDSQDLIDKMLNIYINSSKEKIIKIFNLHPKLAIEKKLTNFSSKEQLGAQLDRCTKEQLLEFEKLNLNSHLLLLLKEKTKAIYLIALDQELIMII